MPKSILYSVAKGFLYGAPIGLFFAIAIYLLATSIVGLGFLPITPTVLAGIIFATGPIIGISKEYGDWAEAEGKSVMYFVAKGFLYGTAIGLFFSTAIYLLGIAVAALGFLTVDPLLLAGIVFATGPMIGIAKEYGDWTG